MKTQSPTSNWTHAARAAAAFAIVAASWLPGATAQAQIANIQVFMDQCATNDPAYATIRADFKIYREGVLAGAIACSEPVSAMPLSQYTDELDAIQALRVIYYMDVGRTNYLQWTPLRLYDWMKTKITGINITSTTTFNYCCVQVGAPGAYQFSLAAANDTNHSYHRSFQGMSSLIALFAHEVRHRDNFPHDSLCGISFGCDLTYDESNLSPYGIQYWLNAHWLSGDINVGVGCLPGTLPYRPWPKSAIQN